MSSSVLLVSRHPAAPGSRRGAITERYPQPPVYADDNAPQAKQPACYDQPEKPVQLRGPKPTRVLRWPEAWRKNGRCESASIHETEDLLPCPRISRSVTRSCS